MFDNNLYLKKQTELFFKKINTKNKTVIEIGGKFIEDYHASRVLPGFDPNNKLHFVNQFHDYEIIMVVNALDIVSAPYGSYPQKRIRGDSQLFYDEETIRIIGLLQTYGLPISRLVVARVKKGNIPPELYAFQEKLNTMNIVAHFVYEYESYKELWNVDWKSQVTKNDLTFTKPITFMVSPGGGSGKFSSCLTGILQGLLQNEQIDYLKYETFPVYDLPPHHYLNIAYLFATVDLGNSLYTNKSSTLYDKDVSNFRLYKRIKSLQKNGCNYLGKPSFLIDHDFSLNALTYGMSDMNEIIEACGEEIKLRVKRYKKEVDENIENQELLVKIQELINIYKLSDLVTI